MKTWWEHLFDLLVGMATKRDLGRAGASPDAMAGSIAIPIGMTGYDVVAEEDIIRRRIVDFMRSQLGKVYQFGFEVSAGREDHALKWDCSELTEAAYRMAGKHIPDGAQNQYDFCQPIKLPRAGDLGFLWSDKRGMIGHVMMASGDGTAIHAMAGRGVVDDPVDIWEHHPRWRGWRRHVDFARPPEDRA